MKKKYIFFIDDELTILHTMKRILTDKFPSYQVEVCQSAKEALNIIDTDINKDGNDLDLLITDEKMPEMQGHELVYEIKKSYPKTKLAVITGYADTDATIKALNAGVDYYFTKPIDDEKRDFYLQTLELLLNERERHRAKRLFLDNNTVIKVAETKYEKEKWFEQRFKTYVNEIKHISLEKLTEQQKELCQEWDKYDLLPSTTQVVILRKFNDEVRAIGGARIMENIVCMEEGFNQENYKKSGAPTLDSFREKGIIPREISRLIIDQDYRKERTLLIDLLRFLFDLTRDNPYRFCTSKEDKTAIYKKIGFLQLGPPFEYSLEGLWVPMVMNDHDIFERWNKSEDYAEFNIHFYNAISRPILSEDDKVNIGIKIRDLFINNKYFMR